MTTMTTTAAALAAEAIRRREERYAEAITAARHLAAGDITLGAEQWEAYAAAAGTTIEGYAAIIDAFAALAPVRAAFARGPEVERTRDTHLAARERAEATHAAEVAALSARIERLTAAHRAAAAEIDAGLDETSRGLAEVDAARKRLIAECADPALVRRRAEAIRRHDEAQSSRRPLADAHGPMAEQMRKMPAGWQRDEVDLRVRHLARQIAEVDRIVREARDERLAIEEQMLTP